MKKSLLSNILSILSLFLLFSGCSVKQTEKNNAGSTSFFNDGDRVCFIGNSITDMGMYHNNIYLFHITRFPYQYTEMYNCGVSGDVTGGVLNRMEDDILSKKPTQAVIMLGMNDVQRNLYGPNITTNEDTLQRRKDAVALYKANFDSIINILLSKKVKIILERPTIYDQTAIMPEPNHLGVNDVLGECALFIDTLAEKYNLPIVDYYTIMNRINAQVQKKDSSATITRFDRIHPEETGHFVMAYQFLKSEKAPQYVSRIVVDANAKIAADESYNCEISDIKQHGNTIEFSVKEGALPFPVKDAQKDALKLVPFMNDLNQEVLKIKGLKKGNHQLTIDDVSLGDFTADQLVSGINMAKYNSTPQYQQANEVRKKLEELWKIESTLRGMKFIEYMDDYKACPDKQDLEQVNIFLDSIFSNYDDPFYKEQLHKFLQNKPKEKELKNRASQIPREAYGLAKPKKHIYKLKLL